MANLKAIRDTASKYAFGIDWSAILKKFKDEEEKIKADKEAKAKEAKEELRHMSKHWADAPKAAKKKAADTKKQRQRQKYKKEKQKYI